MSYPQAPFPRWETLATTPKAASRQGAYWWRHCETAWLYVDAYGVVRGRVDEMVGGEGPPWYWWQTARATGDAHTWTMAGWCVERVLVQMAAGSAWCRI